MCDQKVVSLVWIRCPSPRTRSGVSFSQSACAGQGWQEYPTKIRVSTKRKGNGYWGVTFLSIHYRDCCLQKATGGTSLVVQWLRIRLPMQGARVRALVREDPTCCTATKSVCHNYWACTLEPVSHNYWGCVPQLLKPAHLEPMLCNKRSHRNKKPTHRNEE